MLVTEREAKFMWCPQGAPRTMTRTINCIGSSCMWWRWRDTLTENLTPVRVNQGGGLVDLEKRRGYCGMAGTP